MKNTAPTKPGAAKPPEVIHRFARAAKAAVNKFPSRASQFKTQERLTKLREMA